MNARGEAKVWNSLILNLDSTLCSEASLNPRPIYAKHITPLPFGDKTTFLGTKVHCFDLILRVTEYIVTIYFGVYLYLFNLFCNVCVCVYLCMWRCFVPCGYFSRDRWQALVYAVTSLLVTQNSGNFLTSWGTVSFSRKTLLHRVNKYNMKTHSKFDTD